MFQKVKEEKEKERRIWDEGIERKKKELREMKEREEKEKEFRKALK